MPTRAPVADYFRRNKRTSTLTSDTDLSSSLSSSAGRQSPAPPPHLSQRGSKHSLYSLLLPTGSIKKKSIHRRPTLITDDDELLQPQPQPPSSTTSNTATTTTTMPSDPLSLGPATATRPAPAVDPLHVAQLEARIPKLEMEIDDLQFEIETLQEQLAAQRVDAKDEIQVLRFQLEHARGEARRLQAELDDPARPPQAPLPASDDTTPNANATSNPIDGQPQQPPAARRKQSTSSVGSANDAGDIPMAPPAAITRSLEWGAHFGAGRMALEKELEEMREQAVGARAEREILQEDVREAREEIERLVRRCAELEAANNPSVVVPTPSSSGGRRPSISKPTSPPPTNRDRAALAKERAALVKDRETLFKDRAALLHDRGALIKDTATLHAERSALSSERQAIAEERLKVWQERQDLEQDRQALESNRRQVGDAERASLEEERASLEEERNSLDAERVNLEQERGRLGTQREQLDASKERFGARKVEFEMSLKGFDISSGAHFNTSGGYSAGTSRVGGFSGGLRRSNAPPTGGLGNGSFTSGGLNGFTPFAATRFGGPADSLMTDGAMEDSLAGPIMHRHDSLIGPLQMGRHDSLATRHDSLSSTPLRLGRLDSIAGIGGTPSRNPFRRQDSLEANPNAQPTSGGGLEDSIAGAFQRYDLRHDSIGGFADPASIHRDSLDSDVPPMPIGRRNRDSMEDSVLDSLAGDNDQGMMDDSLAGGFVVSGTGATHGSNTNPFGSLTGGGLRASSALGGSRRTHHSSEVASQLEEERAELLSARESLINDRIMLNARTDSLEVERRFFEKEKEALTREKMVLTKERKRIEDEKRRIEDAWRVLDLERRLWEDEKRRAHHPNAHTQALMSGAVSPSISAVGGGFGATSLTFSGEGSELMRRRRSTVTQQGIAAAFAQHQPSLPPTVADTPTVDIPLSHSTHSLNNVVDISAQVKEESIPTPPPGLTAVIETPLAMPSPQSPPSLPSPPAPQESATLNPVSPSTSLPTPTQQPLTSHTLLLSSQQAESNDDADQSDMDLDEYLASPVSHPNLPLSTLKSSTHKKPLANHISPPLNPKRLSFWFTLYRTRRVHKYVGLFEGLTWDAVGRLGVPDLEVRAVNSASSTSSSFSMVGGEKDAERDSEDDKPDLPVTMQEEYGTGPGTPAYKLRQLIDRKGEHVAEAPFNTLVSCLGIIARLLGIEREMELRRAGSGNMVPKIVHPQSEEVVDTEVLPMEDRPAALEALVQHLPVLPAKRTGRKETTNKKKRRQRKGTVTDADEFPPLPTSPTTSRGVAVAPRPATLSSPKSPVSASPSIASKLAASTASSPPKSPATTASTTASSKLAPPPAKSPGAGSPNSSNTSPVPNSPVSSRPSPVVSRTQSSNPLSSLFTPTSASPSVNGVSGVLSRTNSSGTPGMNAALTASPVDPSGPPPGIQRVRTPAMGVGLPPAPIRTHSASAVAPLPLKNGMQPTSPPLKNGMPTSPPSRNGMPTSPSRNGMGPTSPTPQSHPSAFGMTQFGGGAQQFGNGIGVTQFGGAAGVSGGQQFLAQLSAGAWGPGNGLGVGQQYNVQQALNNPNYNVGLGGSPFPSPQQQFNSSPFGAFAQQFGGAATKNTGMQFQSSPSATNQFQAGVGQQQFKPHSPSLFKAEPLSTRGGSGAQMQQQQQQYSRSTAAEQLARTSSEGFKRATSEGPNDLSRPFSSRAVPIPGAPSRNMSIDTLAALEGAWGAAQGSSPSSVGHYERNGNGSSPASYSPPRRLSPPSPTSPLSPSSRRQSSRDVSSPTKMSTWPLSASVQLPPRPQVTVQGGRDSRGPRDGSGRSELERSHSQTGLLGTQSFIWTRRS